MDQLQYNILSTLAYFDIFDYPLKKEEIHTFLGQETSANELASALGFMTHAGSLKNKSDFFSLRDDFSLVERRLKGNERADRQLPFAKRAGSFLSGFPYVRAIGISGSLSKNFADEKSDIDFFIITAKNRVWLARTFMHIFRKFALLAGKHNWFCMNYYIDEEALEIKEKNIFTAMELVTVLPVKGKNYFEAFFKANEWVKEYFPLCEPRQAEAAAKKSLWKQFVETLFNNHLGDAIDKWLMKMTRSRWQQKTERKKRNSQGILLGMDSDRHYAKPSPNHLQAQILRQYQIKMEELTAKPESRLSKVI